MKDYYEILEVSKDVSEAELKRAFRRLAVAFHPDKNPDPVAQQRFIQINEAYEVLGDPGKRSSYDARLANPFSEIVEEPVQPSHRDPAYRRARAAAERSKREEPTLTAQYLKYVHWCCWVGLVLSSLFFIDYILPYDTIVDKVVSSEVTRGRRGGVAYITSTTASGAEIKHYSIDGPCVLQNSNDVIWQRTQIFRTPMEATGEWETERLGHMYGALAFLPLIVLLTSLAGLIFKKRADLSFNMSLVCFVFMIFTYVLSR